MPRADRTRANAKVRRLGYPLRMSLAIISRCVNPWKSRREQEARRVQALRTRDGDNCARCRRPLRFDLPAGHDEGAKIEVIVSRSGGGGEALDNLCLCHGRCNAKAGDDTIEVTARVRRKSEAELLEPAESRRSA